MAGGARGERSRGCGSEGDRPLGAQLRSLDGARQALAGLSNGRARRPRPLPEPWAGAGRAFPPGRAPPTSPTPGRAPADFLPRLSSTPALRSGGRGSRCPALCAAVREEAALGSKPSRSRSVTLPQPGLRAGQPSGFPEPVLPVPFPSRSPRAACSPSGPAVVLPPFPPGLTRGRCRSS